MSLMSAFLRSAAVATRLSVGPSARLPLPLAARQPLRAFRTNIVCAEGGKVSGTVKWCALRRCVCEVAELRCTGIYSVLGATYRPTSELTDGLNVRLRAGSTPPRGSGECLPAVESDGMLPALRSPLASAQSILSARAAQVHYARRRR